MLEFVTECYTVERSSDKKPYSRRVCPPRGRGVFSTKYAAGKPAGEMNISRGLIVTENAEKAAINRRTPKKV